VSYNAREGITSNITNDASTRGCQMSCTFLWLLLVTLWSIGFTEMLAKFTEEETLEGNIYACEKCNKSK